MMTGTVALSRMLWMSAVTAARDQAVDRVELHQLDGGFVANVLDEHHAVAREPGLGRRVAQHLDDRDVRSQRGSPSRAGATALPDFRQMPAASLVTFGPVLVDDRDHAERHADPLDLETVRPLPPVEHLADRIGQPGDVAEPFGHRLDAGVGEPQTVERPGLHAGGGGVVEVERVRREDLAAAIEEQVGGGVERRVLLGRSTRERGALPRPSRAAPARTRRRARTSRRSVTGSHFAPSDTSGRAEPSGVVRPCRRTQPRGRLAQRPGATRSHPLPLLAGRRSPRPRTLPPPVGDEFGGV